MIETLRLQCDNCGASEGIETSTPFLFTIRSHMALEMFCDKCRIEFIGQDNDGGEG